MPLTQVSPQTEAPKAADLALSLSNSHFSEAPASPRLTCSVWEDPLGHETCGARGSGSTQPGPVTCCVLGLPAPFPIR